MKDNINEIEGKWEFNERVALSFDDMISRSIPNYETMREMTYNIGRNFLKEGGLVLDLGCSNGLSIEGLIRHFDANKFILSDISKPMLKICKNKFKDEINSGKVEVIYRDLREDFLYQNVNLIISSLTIQFTPIEFRQSILQNIYNSLNVGGAFIYIEKVLGEEKSINDLLVKEYYNIKQKNGYSLEQIENKKKSLEGTLVPLTPSMNEFLLKSAGFKKIDCFWRCLNFMAWIAIK